MILGLSLYRFFTRLATPAMGFVLQHRVTRGKDKAHRLNERRADTLPLRPERQLIWLHGASVGESMLLLETAARLRSSHPDAAFLFTCQTLTGADTITNTLEADSRFSGAWAQQNMAPVDLPSVAKRFIAHWQPDLAIFAEGEIWPNLLLQLQSKDIPTALINARMTTKSISGWRRWPRTARAVFSCFDKVLASDKKTAIGIENLRGAPVPCPGNLKSALPVPRVNEADVEALRKAIGDRPVLVAASTHSGEETLILDAYMQMAARPFLIIAPRHPERGDQIERLLSLSRLEFSRRSVDSAPSANADVLLADTLGEMGLWYRLATTVYLGGGHTPGVGGHNPLEAIRLGKPVLTGPSLFNFEEIADKLVSLKALTIVDSVEDIVKAFPAPLPSKDTLGLLEAQALGPMQTTLNTLNELLMTSGQKQ